VASVNGVGGKSAFEYDEKMDEDERRHQRFNRAHLSAAKAIIIDEISTLGQRGTAENDGAMRKGSISEVEPWGGKHAILVGDFLQLPPVCDRASYEDKVTLKKSLENLEGRFTWENINKVVLLTQQQRQIAAEAQPWHQLLTRLSEGTCTQADFERLEKHVIGDNDNATRLARTPRFQRAPIIVSRNLARMAICNEYLQSYAKVTGKRMFVSRARDKLAQGRSPGPQMKKKLLDKPDNKTNFHAGKLLLVEGMEVMLKTNLSVKRRLTNGSRGKLLSIIFDKRENQTLIDQAPMDQAYGLQYQPTCLLVHFPESTANLPGFPEKVVPVYPIMKDFIHYTTIKTGDKNLVTGKDVTRKTKTVKRTQLPVLSAKAITDYVIQGSTMSEGIIDLTTSAFVTYDCNKRLDPKSKNKFTQQCSDHPAKAYVPASRFRSEDDFLILRRFSIEALKRKPPESYYTFQEKLVRIARATQAEFDQRHKRQQTDEELSEAEDDDGPPRKKQKTSRSNSSDGT